jgi:hypothetical protein
MSSKRETNSHKYSHNYRDKQELEALSDTRIITKNLVYIIGLSGSLANKEKLGKPEYLGQYGTIQKIVVNKSKAYNKNSPFGPSYSAYVTYSKPSEASIAILSLDNKKIDNHLIRASFGTTKYCSYFLKGIECNNKECLFLHKWAEESSIIKREDLISNKSIFKQQHNFAKKIADIYNPEVKKKIIAIKVDKSIFPPPEIIYKNLNLKDKKDEKFRRNDDTKMDDDDDYYDDEDDDEEEEEEDDDDQNDNYDDNDISNNDKVEKKQVKIENGTENKNQKEIVKKNKINKRDRSRFIFCENNCEGGGVVVPPHILNLIDKKINLYNLTKYMQQKVIDKVFLDEWMEKIKNDEWIKFISDNININYKNKNKKDGITQHSRISNSKKNNE